MGQQVCGSLGTGAPGLPSPSPCPAPSPPLHPESPCGPWGPVGQQGLSSVLSPSLHPSRSLWRTAGRTRVLCFGGFSYSCGSPGVPPSWSGQPRSWSLICDRAPPKGSLSCARYHPLTSPPEDRSCQRVILVFPAQTVNPFLVPVPMTLLCHLGMRFLCFLHGEISSRFLSLI